MGIVVDQISKHYVRRREEIIALQSVSLQIEDGEFVAFVGPSGCGKSTLMNMIAGIIPATSGTILHDGRPVLGVNTAVGYMTQIDSLLPWRTTEDNIALALQLRGTPKREMTDRVDRMLDLVKLTQFRHHYPVELSGGMRKRVALAQVLAYDPDTLLMDEPFGALDAQLKLVMQDELLRIWDRSRKTVVFVTHDLGEAIAVADWIVVFSSRPGRINRIEKIDLPRPRNVFQIRFAPRFQEIYESIWAALEPEIQREEAL